MPDDVKRSYRSSVRDAQAAATRAALREAAARLFVDQGYVATSIRQVAQAAGVAERTVYLAFPSKAALFQHTLNVAIVGDEGQRSVGDRMADEVLTLQDPHTVLAVTLDQAADLLDRAGDLIMVSVEAAGADPDMRAAAEAGSRATHAHYLALTEHLDRLGALAPGMHSERGSRRPVRPRLAAPAPSAAPQPPVEQARLSGVAAQHPERPDPALAATC